ncbi:amino acid adenylation domain-containing protein [Flagellimonas sp. HMM57]|uniref:polyketide synthase n=1 Tax=unclassified Flagellimonas TaxID=2644544 RepID=UPI0013D8BB78|nr:MULTISPECIES: polyketide synthase [unclassified Flagellimonas]UII76108.1 amino acid adenylation domain-containing protein [Flagellimonas sp. HMM57]
MKKKQLTSNDKKLLDAFNDTSFDFPNNLTIVDLFQQQVDKTPENIAVVFKDSVLTYLQLNELSNKFANFLGQNYDLKKGDFIGLMLERSEYLIISILGILKTGCAYVPIDIEAPLKRKEYVQNDSSCKITVDEVLLGKFKTREDHYSSKVDVSPVKTKDLAYIIYTSGTTGNPKGVMVEHASVVNLIFSLTQFFQIDSSDKTLLFSNYFFDASIEQMFLALLNGGELVVIDKKDIKDHILPSIIEKYAITHLNATPSYLDTLPDLSHLKSLKLIVTGGEVCSLKLANRMAGYCNLYNTYGPTENTVTSTVLKYSERLLNEKSFPIGKPIHNTKAYVLSENLDILPVGEVGELCLAGSGLARGYLNNEKLTAEKFIDNPFEPGNKMYRTGDFAKWKKDGTLEFLGRKDDQVKIRGYRIELGEIETVLNAIKGIKKAIVLASNHFGTEPSLISYLQATEDKLSTQSIKEEISKTLPVYMIPTIFMWIEEFPINRNGKVDKTKLPVPAYQRPDSAPIYRKPRTKTEKQIAQIWSETLSIPKIGLDDNFFELGGTSLLTQKLATVLTENLDTKVPVTKIYQNPTISQLVEFLEKDKNKIPMDTKRRRRPSSREVAIIGMAGRFPGANTIDELWKVLEHGKETISFFSKQELDKSIPESLRNDPLYVGARGIVPSAKEFDARFFGMSPKLAEAMDPQQRLFLEIAWEALEQSGYLPKHYDGTIGVYAGAGGNTYYTNNVLPNQELLNQVGSFQANTVNDKDYIATRTAYHLDLKGPAVNVYSACSTSLLAIAEAVEAIRSGRCEIALAGAASVTAPMYSGHLYQEGSMLSSDGHCRPFDIDAKGTVFSDGAGVVLLKDLADAKKDGDIIHGIIKGIGVNNDGGNKGSFTAPSIQGQAGAISSALADARITPDKISYVEAHGTATPLGDPIEIEGLHMVFGKKAENKHCAIGSIKSNMGHLTSAAGVAGLIKTLLAMKHNKIPPSIGFEEPNPAIDFKNSPFYVNQKLNDWKSNGTKKAGISSFGVGGTNVHIIVEEHADQKQVSNGNERPIQFLPWSAKTKESLLAYQKALGTHLKEMSKPTLSDIAFSLSTTRDLFSHRSFVLSNDKNDLANMLLLKEENDIKSNVVKVMPSELVFLFPGQGSQYPQMGRALYENEPVFREAVTRCAKLLQNVLELDIREVIYPELDTLETKNRLKDTKYTQPALFVVEYALAQLWVSWGVKPTVLCGHSIGEFVAAHLAGVFSLEDALRLITIRGKLISGLPGGSMLSVRMDAENITKLLPETLSIAAINSDQLCVVSGPDKIIEQFASQLKEKGIACMILATSHAFHSNMMNPILDSFKIEVEKVSLNIPRLPMVSTVSGTWLSDAEATDPEYWTNHLRKSVRFSDALETMLATEDTILLEVGPGRALTTLSNQKKGLKSLVSLSSLPTPKAGYSAYNSILIALGNLWLNGIEPNWREFYKDQTRQKVLLPSYVFDKKPCWIEPLAMESNKNTLVQDPNTSKPEINQNSTVMREEIILEKISDIITNTSGIELETSEYNLNFLELGLDSLVLTQMALTCKNEFKLPITFRQLNDSFNSPTLLAKYLDENLPKDMYAHEIDNNQNTAPIQNIDSSKENLSFATNGNQDSALSLIAQQIQLLGKQIELMQGNESKESYIQKPKSEVPIPKIPTANDLSEDEKRDLKKPFGASPRIERNSTGLNPSQADFLKDLISNYNKKTAKSKSNTQHNRRHMADPRVVSGFKPLTKELVYPIIIEKSLGNKLWDLDGNEYLDTVNGFGSCFFGYQPDFITEVLHKQIDTGFEVGPQHPLAGEVCELLCEFTGHERAGLCNTGSEAVLGAMRIARTVTGRSLIVAFKGSYHGINDEALVRGSKKLKTFPAAAGVLPSAVQNVLILDYGTQKSLDIIKNRANELAAVLVEPVQSRRPEFQPVEFLKEVREITKASETVLIFDEIITGFRMHPGGAQALFDIKADVATYGKVIGGGISIGAILGDKKYMDALDGGFWNYGDDSFPEVGVTYFAGTFVRHPLALASAKASLTFMKQQGGNLQNRLNEMTKNFALDMNSSFKTKGLPLEITYFGSLWRLTFLEEMPYSELLFVLLRKNGIHILDGFSCFVTNAYTIDDMQKIKKELLSALEELANVNFLPNHVKNSSIESNEVLTAKKINTPPLEGAKLGIDEDGNPAWYVVDKTNQGEYLKIDL